MNRKRLHGKMLVLLSASFLFIGCASTFLVSKDCRTYYFGSEDQILYNMICKTGDLEKVLSDSGLPEDTRTALYKAQCTDRSRDKVNQTYMAMSNKQQDALRDAFKKNGYEINAKVPTNYNYYDYYYNEDVCPKHRYGD